MLMCVAANGCELPLTHKNNIQRDKLAAVSFVLVNLQSKHQSRS